MAAILDSVKQNISIIAGRGEGGKKQGVRENQRDESGNYYNLGKMRMLAWTKAVD